MRGSWWNGFGFTRVHTQGESARPCCRLAKNNSGGSWGPENFLLSSFRGSILIIVWMAQGEACWLEVQATNLSSPMNLRWQMMSKCHSSKWLTNMSETLGPLGPLDLIWILTNSCNNHHKHEHKDLTRQWDSILLAFFSQYLTFPKPVLSNNLQNGRLEQLSRFPLAQVFPIRQTQQFLSSL